MNIENKVFVTHTRFDHSSYQIDFSFRAGLNYAQHLFALIDETSQKHDIQTFDFNMPR